MKRKIHSWRRRRSGRPKWPIANPLEPARIAAALRQDLRCFCKRCRRQDKREKFGAWQMSLLPLMGVRE
jgi:hypothetical protein